MYRTEICVLHLLNVTTSVCVRLGHFACEFHTHTHSRNSSRPFRRVFKKKKTTQSIDDKNTLAQKSTIPLTVRGLLRFPDESATMKVNSASFLFHHERVQEHSPGGLVRDLLHHTDCWFWLSFHASSFNGRTATESFPRRLFKRQANDDRRRQSRTISSSRMEHGGK